MHPDEVLDAPDNEDQVARLRWRRCRLTEPRPFDPAALDRRFPPARTATAERGVVVHLGNQLRNRAELDVEGVVAKRVDSPNRPRVRSGEWPKLKTADWKRGHAPRRRPR